MTAQKALAVAGWFGIGIAAGGILTVDAEVMATGMLTAGLFGLAWGYVTYNPRRPATPAAGDDGDDGACPVCDHPYGELAHACIGLRDAESSHLHQPAQDRRPVWDTNIMGAPE